MPRRGFLCRWASNLKSVYVRPRPSVLRVSRSNLSQKKSKIWKNLAKSEIFGDTSKYVKAVHWGKSSGGSISLSGCHFFHRHSLEACDSANQSTWIQLSGKQKIKQIGQLYLEIWPPKVEAVDFPIVISLGNTKGNLAKSMVLRVSPDFETTSWRKKIMFFKNSKRFIKFSPCAFICAIARLQRVSVKKTARW